MRFYREKYPEAEELVMVQVRQIAEMGAYVKLLEYDNVEGMIQLSELSRRRIRSIQKLIRVGRNEVVVTMRVDKEKGYIDLSKRRVSPEDITKCEDRYIKSKTVASIMRYVSSKLEGTNTGAALVSSSKATDGDNDEAQAEEEIEQDTVGGVTEAGGLGKGEEELELLYEKIAWPLADKYGHPYEAFKLALTERDEVFSGIDVPQETLDLLHKTIAQRLTPQPIKLRADIELTCFREAGIDAIKRALTAGEAVSTAAVPIKAKLIAPPFYVLDTNATDKVAGVAVLEKAIEAIESAIAEEGGDLKIKMKPKAVSDSDDQELAALLAKATKENTQVSGDEADEGSEDEDNDA